MTLRKLGLILALTAITSLSYSQFLFRKNARVLTDAWASPEFVERRETPEGPARLSYHFYEGNFHGGAINDKSITRLSLNDIAEILAKDMAEQNYFPAESLEDGDLVIIVHWGITEVEEKWDELFPENDSSSDTGLSEDGGSDSSADNVPEFATYGRSSVAQNARLTGIQKALRKKGLTESEREEIRSLLDEERYFIVLMAYDWQLLQKEKKHQLLWTCRFSLPATGTNFVDAVPSLSRVAAPLLGSNQNDLIKNKTQLGWGKGTVGELEVLESLSEEEMNEIKK